MSSPAELRRYIDILDEELRTLSRQIARGGESSGMQWGILTGEYDAKKRARRVLMKIWSGEKFTEEDLQGA